MAIVVVFEAPGMTATQYDQAMQALVAIGAGHPEGRLYHVSAASETGFVVVDVWESEEDLARFTETMLPILQATGAEQPQARVYPVHNMVSP